MREREVWDLEVANAGLRQQLADLREQLVAEKAKVWALEERLMDDDLPPEELT